MRKNRTCLIAFTFGKLPAYFDLWLQGASLNDDYDFLIYTDDRAEYKYPPNVRVMYTTFAECVARAQKIYDFKIAVPIPYKFCDFRPAFGEIFAADLGGTISGVRSIWILYSGKYPILLHRKCLSSITKF